MDPHDNTYRSWLLADPKAFVAGVRGFCKQAAERPAIAALVNLAALNGKPRLFMDDDGMLQVIGDKPPKAKDTLIVSEVDALEMVRQRLLANRMRKQAAAEDSLWQRIKPWLLLLGGGYLALKGGERWGRFAQEHDYPQGPVKGPLVAALGALLPPDMKVQGTLTRGEAKLRKLTGSDGSAENPGITPLNGYY
jgi:hypothetical protein